VLLLQRTRSRVLTNFDTLRMRAAATGAEVRVLLDGGGPGRRRDVWRLFGRADVVVGAHGAGLANALAARPGAAVLEVSPGRWRVPLYPRLSAVLGLTHHSWAVGGAGKDVREMEAPLGGEDGVMAALCGHLRGVLAAAGVEAGRAPPTPPTAPSPSDGEEVGGGGSGGHALAGEATRPPDGPAA
jgi:hypothetical protein